jgi:hypothetical protein
MREAIEWIEGQGISYKYFPPYQLKIGSINFWPGTGTITIDGEIEKRPIKGLKGLAKLLTTAPSSMKNSTWLISPNC